MREDMKITVSNDYLQYRTKKYLNDIYTYCQFVTHEFLSTASVSLSEIISQESKTNIMR